MGRGTKLRSASRYGPRYGSTLKKKVADIEEVQKKPQICPQCEKKSLRRANFGIWRCTKCGTEMAGGAYSPRTAVGMTAQKTITAGAIPKDRFTEEISKEEPKKTEKRETRKRTLKKAVKEEKGEKPKKTVKKTTTKKKETKKKEEKKEDKKEDKKEK